MCFTEAGKTVYEINFIEEFHVSTKMNEKIRQHHELQNVAAQTVPNDLSDDELFDLYLSLPEKQREKKFASTERAAKIIGLSQRTIQLWVEAGLVRAVMIGRKYQVSLDSLKAYLKSRVDKSA